MQKNIFVVGLDDFYGPYLKTVRHAESYAFHRLLDVETAVQARRFDLPALLDEAAETLDSFGGKVDAIVGYWDFPTTLMLPLLRRHVGLPGPKLESVLRCEHKYWSRLLQAEVAAENVPRFALVDPFKPDAALPDLPFPFWMKPVKAHSSALGFRIGSRDDFDVALRRARAGISRFADPMNVIMSRADLPDRIAGVHGGMCIAEEMISQGRRQCTLEGYVYRGEPHVYGVVDSIRGPNRSSFTRYEYPSSLAEAVQERMVSIACRVIRRTGLDDSPFNVEFYWDRRTDGLSLLEINARLSKSHFPLFAMVEGAAHAEVMIDLALGRAPEYPLRDGDFQHAAKFMARVYGADDDARITSAPDDGQVRAIEERVPGSGIELHARRGMRMGDIVHQDSYSHEVAVVYVGARSRSSLNRKYQDSVARLGIEIDGERWQPQ